MKYKTCKPCAKAFSPSVIRCLNCGGPLNVLLTPEEIEAKINAALDNPNSIDGRGARESIYRASRYTYKGD